MWSFCLMHETTCIRCHESYQGFNYICLPVSTISYIVFLKSQSLIFCFSQALSTDSIEKLPVFNKTALRHYKSSHEADDWCVPRKDPLNLSMYKVEKWTIFTREIWRYLQERIDRPPKWMLAFHAGLGTSYSIFPYFTSTVVWEHLIRALTCDQKLRCERVLSIPTVDVRWSCWSRFFRNEATGMGCTLWSSVKRC